MINNRRKIGRAMSVLMHDLVECAQILIRKDQIKPKDQVQEVKKEELQVTHVVHAGSPQI